MGQGTGDISGSTKSFILNISENDTTDISLKTELPRKDNTIALWYKSKLATKTAGKIWTNIIFRYIGERDI